MPLLQQALSFKPRAVASELLWFVFAGSEQHPLPCEAEHFQAHSEFEWHPDATVKLLGSGMCTAASLPTVYVRRCLAAKLVPKARVKWTLAARGPVEGGCRAARWGPEDSVGGLSGTKSCCFIA